MHVVPQVPRQWAAGLESESRGSLHSAMRVCHCFLLPRILGHCRPSSFLSPGAPGTPWPSWFPLPSHPEIPGLLPLYPGASQFSSLINYANG